jgi:hypothetical protein
MPSRFVRTSRPVLVRRPSSRSRGGGVTCGPGYTGAMADLPIRLADETLRERLAMAVDPDDRIVQALGRLGVTRGTAVRLAEPDGGARWRSLEGLGAQVLGPTADDAAAPAEVTLAAWPLSRRAGSASDPEAAVSECLDDLSDRQPTGRLLIVEDYGRDEVSSLIGGPERERALVTLSHRRGPFLSRGFRIRVVHCWWRWDTLEEARSLLSAAFGQAGERVAAGMRAPRLAYKVALYHRGAPEVPA